MSTSLIEVDEALLAHWPLPQPDAEGDKEHRGRVLIVGGSSEVPGAATLAGIAALRAGAGKLAIATPASIASILGLAVPEARVFALPETADGGVWAHAAEALPTGYNAVLIGPGMQDSASLRRFVSQLLPRMSQTPVVLDACAMDVVLDREFHAFSTPVLMTPHAGEFAHLSGLSKEAVLAAPQEHALNYARQWNAMVALKGSITLIAAPDGRLWRHEGGNVGLATSGSGDALAGLIAGLAARGASLEQACVWGVALHGRAGERLATRMGRIGYLAREIAAEVPALMEAYAAGR